MLACDKEKKKTLIPAFSRRREKEIRAAVRSPLPLAGEGRVRVFFLSVGPSC